MSKWISVKDRLPDIGVEVNVLLTKNKIYPERRNVTSLSRYIRHENAIDYYWDNNYGGCNYKSSEVVTHWMPLPSPPKEQT